MAGEATHVGVETVGEWYRQLADEAGKSLLDLGIGSDLPGYAVAAGSGYHRRDIRHTQLSIERGYHCSGAGWYPNRTYSDITTVASRRGVGEKGIVSIGREFTAAGGDWGEPVVTGIEVFGLRPQNYIGKIGLGLVACRVGLSYGQPGVIVWRPEGDMGTQDTLSIEAPTSEIDRIAIGHEFPLSTMPDVVQHRIGVVRFMIAQGSDLSTALRQNPDS